VIAFDYSGKTNPGGQRFVAAQKSGALTKQCPPSLRVEIFICVDEAVLQARKFGTSWQSEVVRYLVHGVLHLLGFDDSNAGARRKMKLEENRRLREMTRRFPLSKL
jgi:rRNA maturation RNase YbeY